MSLQFEVPCNILEYFFECVCFDSEYIFGIKAIENILSFYTLCDTNAQITFDINKTAE